MDSDGAQRGVQAGGGVGDALAAPGREERRQGDGENPGREQSRPEPRPASSASRACPTAVTSEDDEEDEQRQDRVVSRAGLTGCRGQRRGASGLSVVALQQELAGGNDQQRRTRPSAPRNPQDRSWRPP